MPTLAVLMVLVSGAPPPSEPRMLRDINSQSEQQEAIQSLHGIAYFKGWQRATGWELWRSDGTSDGTVLVKDLVPGPVGSRPSQLTVAGDTLFFAAQAGPDPDHDWGFWKSDGTESGTMLLKDLPFPPSGLTAGNGAIFFLSDSLWRSDGTPEGTVPLDLPIRSPYSFHPYQDMILFFGFDGLTAGLWRTDGTQSGSLFLKELHEFREPLEIGGILYFSASSADQGQELWRTDGTPQGTFVIKDIFPGPDASLLFNLVEAGGLLYFFADDGVHGGELWRSDGTEAGTWMVKDVLPGPWGAWSIPISWNGAIYFLVDYPASEQGIWRSDGTPDGTLLWIATEPTSYPSQLTILDSTIFYIEDRWLDGWDLWKSDGTAGNRTWLHGFPQGFGHSFSAVGGEVFFSAHDGTSGVRLWRSDGTAEGTRQVKDDVESGTSGSSLLWPFVESKGLLYFGSSRGSFDLSLWQTDGTASGTERVAGLEGLATESMIEAGANFYIGGTRGLSGELWVKDQNGASLVKEFPGSYQAMSLSPAGPDAGFFYLFLQSLGYELAIWRSDGTLQGTIPLASFTFGTRSSEKSLADGSLLIAIDGNDGTNSGWILMRSDGTPGGTDIVKRFTSGFAPDLLRSGDEVYFIFPDEAGWALWKSDGTDEGTVPVKRIIQIFDAAVGPGGAVFLAAFDDEHGIELWKSDGTDAGTALLVDLFPGPDGSNPSFLGGREHLYFRADDGVHGSELWKTDGTAEGTVLVKDIIPGPEGGLIVTSNDPLVEGEIIYFAARTSAEGFEPWVSDGTPEGTHLLADINPGSESSSFRNPVRLGRTLIFSADDGAHGEEPWALILPASRGDANEDGDLDISDAVAILSCLFTGGACPDSACAADASGDGASDIADAIFLIEYLFLAGPRPASCGN